MYDQNTQTVSRRRSVRAYGAAAGRGRQQRGSRSTEGVRLIQLVVCLVLFLTIFLGKGIFPQKLGQVQEELFMLISTDFDFRGALSELGKSLAGGEAVLSDLGSFCVEVFGPGEQEDETPAELTTFTPPPLGVLTSEQSFFSRHTSAADRMAHYADLSQYGLTFTSGEPVPDEVPPAEPVPEPETPAAVLEAGAVISVSDYSGQALPEHYTMDKLSLGGLETTTPVLGHLNSSYGYRDHPINGQTAFHSGVDIGGQLGAPIAAFAAGTVEYTGESDAYGLYLQLDHGNGVKSFYGHCSSIEVVKGQTVALGETIARIGSTGVSTGPHLHLELKYEQTRLNPAYYVEFLEPS